MPRQIWTPDQATTVEDGREINRAMCQVYPNEAVADGAYTTESPPTAGQLRAVLGEIAPARTIDPSTGLLAPARALTAYQLKRFDGTDWTNNALLAPPLTLGWRPARYNFRVLNVNVTATITGEFNQALTEEATLYFSTEQGTAREGHEYVGFRRRAVTVPAGSKTFSTDVTIIGGGIQRGTEFYLNIVEASIGDFGTAAVPAFANGPRAVIQRNGTLIPLTISMIDRVLPINPPPRNPRQRRYGSIRGGTAFSIQFDLSRPAASDIHGVWGWNDEAAWLSAYSGYSLAAPNQQFVAGPLAARAWTIRAGARTGFAPVRVPISAVLPGVTTGWGREFVLFGISAEPAGLDDVVLGSSDLTQRILWSILAGPRGG